MDCITGDRIRFSDLIKDIKPEPKHMATKERYPKDQHEPAVYTQIPLYYTEDETPTGTIKAYMYVLSCPVCGQKVKRSEVYCRQCGNKLD